MSNLTMGLTVDHLKLLLDCNRGLYYGQVFGQCTHPIETIYEVAQHYELLSNLAKLSYNAQCTLSWVRYYSIIDKRADTYGACEILREQLDLVSDEILRVLEEVNPDVSLQRDLCHQYRVIMKMSFEEVSAYLLNIQHGEDFVVCLRKIAFATVYHPRWSEILLFIDMVENTHQKFMDGRLDRELSIKNKLLLLHRVEKAKRDMLSDLKKMCD